MKRSIVRLLALAIAASGLFAAACNTTRGAGEDLQKAGEGIQHSAERHGAD